MTEQVCPAVFVKDRERPVSVTDRNRETVPLIRQIAIAKTERRSAAFRGCANAS